MPFEALSDNAEKLLHEIIEHEDNSFAYWLNRFSQLTFKEEQRISSLFDELSDAKMINVFWADNGPCEITVLDKGYTYFSDKINETNNKKKLSRREWCIAIIAAVIGALIGLIPQVIQLFGGK